ncbi:hypothetical protein F8M41_015024 [Gigaspora margarita]|uniref:Uncharacterized protein n=1 Tax=Gigaspora margarita TaxID=4874 RepID=A0A8H4B3J3_GIGMA|nr:hypothetical protein F8M41_015024 [Gigaspora margarita]
MSKDITIYFTHFAAYSQKAYHESFVTRNSIPWWNIDFNRLYVIQYSKRNSKEEFDLLQHTKQIPFFDFFVCQCGIRKYLENNQHQHSFYPHLWHYDDHHIDFQCPFHQRLLKRKKKLKITQKSNQSTKKQSKNDAETEFQEMITICQQILDESYTLKSSEYHPQSLSVK